MTAGSCRPAATQRVRRFYDKAASHYDGWMRPFDRALLGAGRRVLCSSARGRTLEVAVGTGLNLQHYRAEVQLAAVDLSSGMLDIAQRRASALGRQVTFTRADAQRLPFADQTFDSVVCTLAFCEVPDERQALGEAARVLRHGGLLLLLGHVRSPLPLVRLSQAVLAPLMLRAAHDHLLRDRMDHLSQFGFMVERCERSRWGIIEQVIARKFGGDSARTVR